MQNKDAGKKFWVVIGDIHGQISNISRIPELESAQGVIISGDITQLGGCQEAEKVLGALPDLPLYAQIGNMDLPEVDGCLSRACNNIHGRARALSPRTAVFGAGGSTITPFHTPSEFSEEQYAAWLEEGWEKAAKYPGTILISHNPPKDSACDKISSGAHVGSRAVRKFIEEKQPVICVCGHIHEARGTDKIGKTLVLNPGMLSEGSYVLIEEADDGLRAEIKSVA